VDFSEKPPAKARLLEEARLFRKGENGWIGGIFKRKRAVLWGTENRPLLNTQLD
jgi:hypothetical protein